MQAAEAKARRKEEKKAVRTQQKTAVKPGGCEGSDGENGDDAEGENGGFDGVATLGGRTNDASRSMKSKTVANGTSAAALTTEANTAPLLVNPDLPHLSSVLDKADVVVEVLDTRDPLSHRSKSLEACVASKEGQKLLILLNKIGACCFRLLCSTAIAYGITQMLAPASQRLRGLRICALSIRRYSFAQPRL